MLKANGLTHHYTLKPVLKEISFEIPAGQVVALLGPNGIGKTTLMNILGGALSPTFGSVEINGLVRRSTEEDELAIRKQCFYLPADAWIPLGRTGADWLLGVGRLYKIPDAVLFGRAQALVEVFNLEEVAGHPLSGCSTGQQKKWALCGALITDCPILLLDEPFSGGLDPAGILALQRILKRSAQVEGRTVLMTTPVPELVDSLADRILVLEQGRLAADESVEQLRINSPGRSVTGILQERFFTRTLDRLDHYFEHSAGGGHPL